MNKCTICQSFDWMPDIKPPMFGAEELEFFAKPQGWHQIYERFGKRGKYRSKSIIIDAVIAEDSDPGGRGYLNYDRTECAWYLTDAGREYIDRNRTTHDVHIGSPEVYTTRKGVQEEHSESDSSSERPNVSSESGSGGASGCVCDSDGREAHRDRSEGCERQAKGSSDRVEEFDDEHASPVSTAQGEPF